MYLINWFILIATLARLNEAAKVSDAPKLVELVEELNNPEDTNATITCSVGSGELQSLTYEWFKDKERIHAVANKIRIDIPSDNYQSALRIFNLKPQDSALYTCVARNRFGQSKISTKLNVNVQLKWISEPKSMQAQVGKALHLPCSAEGSPMPTVHWFKINEEDSEKEELGSSLRFNSLEQKDAGFYECRASNGLEEDIVARIKLDVLVSKAPKIVDPVERLNHPEGTNATFTCSIGSGDLDNLSYEWRKDDIVLNNLLKSRKLRVSTAPENFQSVLRVINLEPNDAGVYSCLAKNKYGQDKVSTRLNVKVQLKWIVEPKDVQVSLGKPVNVACSADGLPKPLIEWRKLNGKDSNSIGAELLFNSISLDDAGLYECRAKNGVEEDLVSRIELNVLGK